VNVFVVAPPSSGSKSTVDVASNAPVEVYDTSALPVVVFSSSVKYVPLTE